MNWRWLGHSTAFLEMAGLVVYIDPFLLKEKGAVPADVVLVSNPRPGFFSMEDIELIRKEGTVIAGPAEVAKVVAGSVGVAPGGILEVPGLEIRAVPAYTIETEFFPREKQWLGWVVSDGVSTVYHAGATDVIPEMSEVRADLAFLPVSGRYVMGPDEAQRAAELVGARCKVGTILAGDRYMRVPGFSPGR